MSETVNSDLDFISKSSRDEFVELSMDDIDREVRLVELDIKKEILESNRQDRIERKNYATKVYWFLIGFLCVVFGIVIATGICRLPFCLSEKVLIVILTTASANVIGVFAIVIGYLFKDKITQNNPRSLWKRLNRKRRM
jgi:hypothetical protein